MIAMRPRRLRREYQHQDENAERKRHHLFYHEARSQPLSLRYDSALRQ